MVWRISHISKAFELGTSLPLSSSRLGRFSVWCKWWNCELFLIKVDTVRCIIKLTFQYKLASNCNVDTLEYTLGRSEKHQSQKSVFEIRIGLFVFLWKKQRWIFCNWHVCPNLYLYLVHLPKCALELTLLRWFIWSVLWPSVELLSLCGLKPFT